MSRQSMPQQQRGAVLGVVLILLLVMTVLGLASMRSTLLQERMSASLRDRSLSFQAAEAALRQGELLAASRPMPPNVVDCRTTTCDPLPSDWTVAHTATTPLADTAAPQYIVELMADNVPNSSGCTTTVDISEAACTVLERRYRITARSQAADRANVVLQSVYAVP